MASDSNKVLLVELNKDYSHPNEKEEGENYELAKEFASHGQFNQAVAHLEEELELWSAETGIRISLTVEKKKRLVTQPGTMLTKTTVGYCYHTLVFGVFETSEDEAFYKISMGDISPSRSMTYNIEKSTWQFAWLDVTY